MREARFPASDAHRHAAARFANTTHESSLSGWNQKTAPKCVQGGRAKASASRDRRRTGRLAPRPPRPRLQRRIMIMTEDTKRMWDVALAALTVLGACAAFILSLCQWRKGQEWQRAAKGRELVDALSFLAFPPLTKAKDKGGKARNGNAQPKAGSWLTRCWNPTIQTKRPTRGMRCGCSIIKTRKNRFARSRLLAGDTMSIAR